VGVLREGHGDTTRNRRGGQAIVTNVLPALLAIEIPIIVMRLRRASGIELPLLLVSMEAARVRRRASANG
jgi:hypothetical protein